MSKKTTTLVIASVLAFTTVIASYYLKSNKTGEAESTIGIVSAGNKLNEQNREYEIPIAVAERSELSNPTQAPTGTISSSSNAVAERRIINNQVNGLAQEKPLFTQSEKAKRVLMASGKLRQDLNNEAYLEIDNRRLANLKEGDVLPLQIPDLDLDYEIEIKNVKADSRGNKTITGRLPDQDFPYSSVITLNNNSLYANIVTPSGTYSMAGDGHNVWMAETGDLIQGVIPDKYDSDDFTEGEPHEHHDLETARSRKNGN